QGNQAVKDLSDEELKNLPVENVSWNDVQEFIKKLNEREQTARGDWVYRLPKEVEWEYACRGGHKSTGEGQKTSPYYFAKPSASLTLEQANFSGLFDDRDKAVAKPLKRTTRVDFGEPNPLGLHNMHGNVWEWC